MNVHSFFLLKRVERVSDLKVAPAWARPRLQSRLLEVAALYCGERPARQLFDAGPVGISASSPCVNTVASGPKRDCQPCLRQADRSHLARLDIALGRALP